MDKREIEEGHQDLSVDSLSQARPRSLKYSMSLLLTVPMVRGGARCVKDNLVVLPEPLEEIQRTPLITISSKGL